MEGGRLTRPRHCSKGVQPCSRQYVTVAVVIMPTVEFDPSISRTAVRHATTIRGDAYAKIEYVKMCAYFSQDRIRV